MADDPMIPELQLGWARYGGYKAATTLANINTRRDAAAAWLVGESRSGLIRNLTSAQVVAEFGPELNALDGGGRRVSAALLGKGTWWKSRTGLAKSETLGQAFGGDRFRGLALGDRAFIVHREMLTPPIPPRSLIPTPPRRPPAPPRGFIRAATPDMPPPLDYEPDDVLGLDSLFNPEE